MDGGRIHAGKVIYIIVRKKWLKDLLEIGYLKTEAVRTVTAILTSKLI
jgi:hypothetical protein